MKRPCILIAFLCFAVMANGQTIPKVKIDDVVGRFNQKNDTTYVVNFWATFCKPCVAEMPDLIRITDQYKEQKVKLLLVSLDLPSYYPEKIMLFAQKHAINSSIVWLNETNADHFCPMIDPEWSGAIPATIIVNTRTGYKKFFEKDVTGTEFETELRAALQ